MKKFLFLCLALLGFAFVSIGQSIDDAIFKDYVKEVGKENFATFMQIVDVNSTDFLLVQNRITYTEYESWRMCELGYADKAIEVS